MRDFLGNIVSQYGPYIILSYILICIFSIWKASQNVIRKTLFYPEYKSSYSWPGEVYWLHFFWPLMLTGLSSILYQADIGWLMDIFCLFLFIISFGMFYAFYLLQKVLVLYDGIAIVPAFGETKRVAYESMKEITLVKKKKRLKGRNISTASIKIKTDNSDITIDDTATRNILDLIDEILHHVSPEIVEVKDTTVEPKEK